MSGLLDFAVVRWSAVVLWAGRGASPPVRAANVPRRCETVGDQAVMAPSSDCGL